MENFFHQDHLFEFIRPLLFKQDPEKIHEQTLWTMRHVFKCFGVSQVLQHVIWIRASGPANGAVGENLSQSNWNGGWF